MELMKHIGIEWAEVHQQSDSKEQYMKVAKSLLEVKALPILHFFRTKMHITASVLLID